MHSILMGDLFRLLVPLSPPTPTITINSATPVPKHDYQVYNKVNELYNNEVTGQLRPTRSLCRRESHDVVKQDLKLLWEKQML